MSLISVIIPVYNGEKTIENTIKSVLSQSINNFELIIINSASTDSTLEIISQFKDPRIKVFYYPKANVAVNRNRGFKHACSDFISFIDADDLWTKDKLELQYNALINNANAGLVYSWTDCVDERGKFLRRCSYVNWSGDVYCKLLLDDFIGSGSNVMIRRDAFVAVGGFDEILTNAQDTDMWIRLAAKYDFVCVPKPQILYRICNISMSSNVLGLEKSNLEVINRAYSHSKAAQHQHLKIYSLGNLYKYLSYKALDVYPGKQNTFHTARFIFMCLKYDPVIVFKPIFFKALFKLTLMTLLSPKQAKKVLSLLPILSNTSTFLGYEVTS
ncbi:MAG: glycosyltransferase [Mastigocoleus sp. MO_167.B18]|uniref:glycosyltransferase n=1 Tax=Mastigocoleus sp. MO_188.B34 TaxID=3036635 RepID=UPI00261BA52F|nr:glycosyltransferase [Mastigocoleus sp. MO_188.B34]MDJ0696186.1 glycosyltransferase [Mastigocoleus sp. MO_188.B34]MDJ0772179.1 glycosyltransferase [Mastigocoleus sp. MO_167.B18]